MEIGRRYFLRLRRSTDRKPIISHDQQCSRRTLNFAFYRRRIEFSRATIRVRTFYMYIFYIFDEAFLGSGIRKLYKFDKYFLCEKRKILRYISW